MDVRVPEEILKLMAERAAWIYRVVTEMYGVEKAKAPPTSAAPERQIPLPLSTESEKKEM